MQCPVCDVPLKMSERQGIEIDYCAQCRGIWLDRGELDKIIERSTRYEASVDSSVTNTSGSRNDYFDDDLPKRKRHFDKDDYDDRYRDEREHKEHNPRKRKSMLSELFDIFD